MICVIFLILVFCLVVCFMGGLNCGDGVYVFGIVGESDVDGLIVGYCLMVVGEYDFVFFVYICVVGC